MSLYSSMQICGEPQITIERRDGIVWVGVKDGNQAIWMEAQHVHALKGALADFMVAEWADGKSAGASVIAADAAEPAPADWERV